jgi:hypothetical protein
LMPTIKAVLKIIEANIASYSGDLLAENLLNTNLKDFIEYSGAN